MRASRGSKINGQIRVVRVTKTSIKRALEGPDSPIRSVCIIRYFPNERKNSPDV